MEILFMNPENSKTNQPYKFILNFVTNIRLKKFKLIYSFSIYYMGKNKIKTYRNNKLKIIALTWNDEFELPDGFYCVSDIQITLNISQKT